MIGMDLQVYPLKPGKSNLSRRHWQDNSRQSPIRLCLKKYDKIAKRAICISDGRLMLLSIKTEQVHLEKLA